MMITAAQLRAARGLLDWTRTELAQAAKISPETVKNIEHGVFRPQEETAERIVRAFGENDVIFTEDEGVKIKSDSVIRYEGIEGFKRFMDDIYDTAKMPFSTADGDKPIYAASVSDEGFVKYLGDYFTMHIKRMSALQDVKMRILHKKKPETITSEESKGGGYREYRLRSEEDSANVPFYVYGDKLAILIFDNKQPQIVVIQSALVAKAYREQFEAMWKAAEPLNVKQSITRRH